MVSLKSLFDTRVQAAYHIMTALRGPDFSGAIGVGLLKEITTGVIRSFVSESLAADLGIHKSPSSARYAWTHDGPVSEEDIRRVWREQVHFREHVRYAFEALISVGVEEAASHWRWLQMVLDEVYA